jgi:hypothetical protein
MSRVFPEGSAKAAAAAGKGGGPGQYTDTGGWACDGESEGQACPRL